MARFLVLVIAFGAVACGGAPEGDHFAPGGAGPEAGAPASSGSAGAAPSAGGGAGTAGTASVAGAAGAGLTGSGGAAVAGAAGAAAGEGGSPPAAGTGGMAGSAGGSIVAGAAGSVPMAGSAGAGTAAGSGGAAGAGGVGVAGSAGAAGAAPCECTSGPCCDGCHFRPRSTVCDEDQVAETQCVRSTTPNFLVCGSNVTRVEESVQRQFCSGSSAQCDGPTYHKADRRVECPDATPICVSNGEGPTAAACAPCAG